MFFLEIFGNVLANEVVNVAGSHITIRAFYEDLGVCLCEINQSDRGVALANINKACQLALDILKLISFLVCVAKSDSCAVTYDFQWFNPRNGRGIHVSESFGGREVVWDRVHDVR